MGLQVHGALVEVLGVGVLLRGASGIGKSELALELVQRGHRLVADDVVRIRRVAQDRQAEVVATDASKICDDWKPDLDRGEQREQQVDESCGASLTQCEPGNTVLLGRAPDLIRHYMEIRGIGLLCIPDLYGEQAVRLEAKIDLICQLEHWREDVAYERLGLERPIEVLAGASIPIITLPVRPSGSMATLVEVAVRDYIQRRAGVNAAKRLDERLVGQSTGRGEPGEA